MQNLVQKDDGSASFQDAGGQDTIEFGRRPIKAINILRIASNVADTETVTIGSVVFEFDRSADGVTAGRVAVTGHADDTPANASTALVTAINASTACPMTAVKISSNEVLLISKAYGAQAHACTETLAGSNNAFSAATAYGGRASGNTRSAHIQRVPTATEVALGTLEVALPFTPYVAHVSVIVTSTGVAKAWDGARVYDATNNVLKLDNSGATDWAATDTIYISVHE